MKISIIIVVFFCFVLKVNAQYRLPPMHEKTPFDISALEGFSRLMEREDTSKPRYVKGDFIYSNNQNIQLIKEHYQEAYPFIRGFAVIKTNDHYGIINKHGEVVVKPAFNSFYVDEDFHGIMFPQMFFDFQTGKLDTVKYWGDIERSHLPDYSYRAGKKYGVKFNEGSKGIKPVYDSILFASKYYIIAKKSGKYGIIDTTGKEIFPFKYTCYIGPPLEYVSYSGQPYYFAVKRDKEWHYYRNLKELFVSDNEPVYLDQDKFIFKTGTLYNYLDDTGRVVLKRNYKWISTKGCLAINENNEIVFLNSKDEGFVYYKLKEFN